MLICVNFCNILFVDILEIHRLLRSTSFVSGGSLSEHQFALLKIISELKCNEIIVLNEHSAYERKK